MTNHATPLPTLGHQIRLSSCPAGKGIPDGWVRFSPTPYQRLCRFFMAFATAFGLTVLTLGVLYLPDYLMDYAHRDESFLAFFLKFLISAVLFVSLVAALNTIVRDRVFYVHPETKRLVIARRLTPETLNRAMPLPANLQLLSPDGLSRRAQLLIPLDIPTVLAETHGQYDDLTALKNWFETLNKK